MASVPKEHLMSASAKKAKKTNHARNIAVILSIGLFVMFGWNAVGAAQCMSRGGDIQMNGFGFSCHLDYRNR